MLSNVKRYQRSSVRAANAFRLRSATGRFFSDLRAVQFLLAEQQFQTVQLRRIDHAHDWRARCARGVGVFPLVSVSAVSFADVLRELQMFATFCCGFIFA
jgi:hypothetical protein